MILRTLKSWPCHLLQHDYFIDGVIQTPCEMPLVNLVFADGPYNQGILYADDATHDRLTENQYREMCHSAMHSCANLARPGATVWWMCPEQHADWTGQCLSGIIGPRLYRIVWHEAFAQYQGNKGLTKDYRFIFCHRVEGEGKVTFNPDEIRVPSARQEKYKDKRANPKGRVPGCVWSMRRLQGTSVDHVDWHPTQLPPELLERIVKGWSNPGDLVMDAFVGSGSLARVCKRLGRRFIGVDRSETYLDRLAKELK